MVCKRSLISVFRLVKNIQEIHRHFQEAIFFNIFLFFILMNNKSYRESNNDHIIRSSPLQMFQKISVLKTLENPQGNTCAGVSLFIKLHGENFLEIHKKTIVLESCFQ